MANPVARPWRLPLAALLGGWVLATIAIAMAAEGGKLESSDNDLSDRASLQRGAQWFMHYCAGCHSLKYLRYQTIARDLQLSRAEVMANLNGIDVKFDAHMETAMPQDAAARWFGKAPPDLSLVARVRGTDWIYTYLKSFYLDQRLPLGWNNRVFPGVSMPNPLWELQGVQLPQFVIAGNRARSPQVQGLVLGQPGRQTPVEFDQTVRDITNFLEYAGEPAALKRRGLGVWVVLFLMLFTLLAYLLKREYWKDVS